MVRGDSMTATTRRYDIKGGKFLEGHEVRKWEVSRDGDNLIVDGYSMPVEEDPTREFVFQLRKTFIRAKDGIDGLMRYMEREIRQSPTFQCGRGVCQIVNWVTTYGQKKENKQEKEEVTA